MTNLPNVICFSLLFAAQCLQVSNALGGSVCGNMMHTYVLRVGLQAVPHVETATDTLESYRSV